MSLKKIAIATTLALTSSFAMAGNELDYDYVAVGLNDYDGFETVEIDFSKAIDDNFYFSADAESWLDEDVDEDNNSTLYNANLGFNFNIGSKTDAYTEFGFSHVRSEFEGNSDTESGYNAKLGVRSMLTSNFEIDANVQHMDIFDTVAIFNLEGRYHFNNKFSAALKGSVDEDGEESFGVDFRFTF